MKPSPVPSILLFIATAALAFSLFGRGWYTHEDEHVSFHSGPVWGEICFDSGDGMECKTHTMFSDLGGGGVLRLVSMLSTLLGIGGLIVAGIAGIFLLSKPRSTTALVTVILVGGSAFITLVMFVIGVAKGGMGSVPGYGFFIYFLGAALAIVGGFLGMSSSRGGAPVRPGYPMGPPGYGPPGYPPGGGYGGPPGYYPPQQPQMQPQPMAAPPPGPAHTCGTGMTWVAQYGRWFCPRCNQYG